MKGEDGRKRDKSERRREVERGNEGKGREVIGIIGGRGKRRGTRGEWSR